MKTPKLDRISENLRLLNRRWKDMKDDELWDLLADILDRHPHVASTKMDTRNRFWRGRPNAPTEGWTHASELLQPPAVRCTAFGRCNAPGQSMFYASLSLLPVFSETITRRGLIQVLELGPRSGAKLELAQLGEMDHVRRTGRSIMNDPHVRTEVSKIIDLTAPLSDESAALCLLDG
jgi:hypothetical protein